MGHKGSLELTLNALNRPVRRGVVRCSCEGDSSKKAVRFVNSADVNCALQSAATEMGLPDGDTQT